MENCTSNKDVLSNEGITELVTQLTRQQGNCNAYMESACMNCPEVIDTILLHNDHATQLLELYNKCKNGMISQLPHPIIPGLGTATTAANASKPKDADVFNIFDNTDEVSPVKPPAGGSNVPITPVTASFTLPPPPGSFPSHGNNSAHPGTNLPNPLLSLYNHTTNTTTAAAPLVTTSEEYNVMHQMQQVSVSSSNTSNTGNRRPSVNNSIPVVSQTAANAANASNAGGTRRPSVTTNNTPNASVATANANKVHDPFASTSTVDLLLNTNTSSSATNNNKPHDPFANSSNVDLLLATNTTNTITNKVVDPFANTNSVDLLLSNNTNTTANNKPNVVNDPFSNTSSVDLLVHPNNNQNVNNTNKVDTSNPFDMY